VFYRSSDLFSVRRSFLVLALRCFCPGADRRDSLKCPPLSDTGHCPPSYQRGFVTVGGLMSYDHQYRRAAGCLICRPHPARRQTRRPTSSGSDKVRTTVNLKTAKALGLDVPPHLLVAADEVIE
jgi:hypothetical protein